MARASRAALALLWLRARLWLCARRGADFALRWRAAQGPDFYRYDEKLRALAKAARLCLDPEWVERVRARRAQSAPLAQRYDIRECDLIDQATRATLVRVDRGREFRIATRSLEQVVGARSSGAWNVGYEHVVLYRDATVDLYGRPLNTAPKRKAHAASGPWTVL